MRKIAFVLVMTMLLSMVPTSASAVEPRLSSIVPELTFEGTTAKCNVSIVGNSTSEKIEATIRLFCGSAQMVAWTASGNGYIFFSKTKTVLKGYTYMLTVTVTVNGVSYSPVYVTATC